jgi:putative N6-adenine-specific DNA methylase
MKQFECIATTTFGLEAVCKRELQGLGFKIVKTENGKVTFLTDERGIINANLWLRTADRVLLKVLEFKALTFDQLFDGVKAFDWASIIPEDGKFIVNGKSVKSKLFSISDCQRLTKKAIADKLMFSYKIDWLKETGAEYSVLVSLLKDIATITIDTSGVALHKRGYRIRQVEAPLKETLAASLVLLSYYNKDRALYDMFCGSGTIPIEAALIGRNIAPGLNRDFASKNWSIIPKELWKEEIKKAYKAIDYSTDLKIYASDINRTNLEAAKENAEEAGVDDCIEFNVSDFMDVDVKNDYGIIISNPPYGERINTEHQVENMTRNMGKKFNKLDTWSKYFLTSYKEFEKYYKKDSDRKRKLYNGRIETWYYQYYGPRPS